MTQPLKPQITTARVTYAGGRTRTFACPEYTTLQHLADLHHITHGRRVAFLAADGTVVSELGAPPAVVLRCRMCAEPLRRIGQGHGHLGQGLFCSLDCGYSYAVHAIQEEDRGAGVPMTADEVAKMRAAREDREDARAAERAAARTQAAAQARTDARVAEERARGAAKTAELAARRGVR
jgi:hypothetical protein